MDIGKIKFLNGLTICCLPKTHFRFKNMSKLKLKNEKRKIMEINEKNWNGYINEAKQTLREKVKLEIKEVIQCKKGNSFVRHNNYKQPYALNKRVPKYMKQNMTVLNGEIKIQ